MSCQIKIKSYIKTNQKVVFSSYDKESYDKDNLKSRFEIIEDFGFLDYLNDIKRKADKSFSKEYTKSNKVVENIFSIVTSNKYSRGGEYSQSEQIKLNETIKRQISNSVRRSARIGFVIPGFTTKAFNVLKVESRRLPDLAEFASLVRLYEICYQIGKVYPHGAEFVVVTDGLAYSKIFGEDPYFAIAHRQTLEDWTRRTGIEQVVKIVDLATLIPENFNSEYLKTSQSLSKEWSEVDNLEGLVDFIANTKNLVNYEEEIVSDMRLFYQFQHNHDDNNLNRNSIEEKIIEKAMKAAFRYETFLQTSYRLRVIDNTYKQYVRCTGRPKPGQLGIHMIHERSNNFPWNGVGVLKKDGRVDVFPEDRVKYSDKYTPVFIKGDHSAFYYKETE